MRRALQPPRCFASSETFPIKQSLRLFCFFISQNHLCLANFFWRKKIRIFNGVKDGDRRGKRSVFLLHQPSYLSIPLPSSFSVHACESRWMAEGISHAGGDTEEKDFSVFAGILTDLSGCDLQRVGTQLL